MEIGKNIAKLRREQNMTQEQLGQALGISGQAVSKWENGGTPDAEMLPAIADKLGVTIDTLFGREWKKADDMTDSLITWMKSIPYSERMYELFKLLCATFQSPYFMNNEAIEDLASGLELPMKSCISANMINPNDDPMWIRSAFVLDSGLQLGVPAEDCPFFLLAPEPEQGYAANFSDNDKYRELFASLSLPGALELLYYLYSQKTKYYSAPALAKKTGITPEKAEEILHAFSECGIVDSTELETDSGTMNVYILRPCDAFVPFMLLSRWMCDKNDAFICNWNARKKPLLN